MEDISMVKRVFYFLLSVVFTGSLNLMAMEPEQDQNLVDVLNGANRAITIDDLSVELLFRIAGYLGEDPRSPCNLSLVSRDWRDITKVMRDMESSRAFNFDWKNLDNSNVINYLRAISKYKNIIKVRRHYFGGNFKESEFRVLQDFIIGALFEELQKPKDQINFKAYINYPIGLDIDFQNITRSDGLTLLIIACNIGNLDLVKTLLSLGANVNLVHKISNLAPLHIACGFGYFEMAKALLTKGANVNIVGSGGETPLLLATCMGNLRMAKLLLSEGADLNVKFTEDTSFSRFRGMTLIETARSRCSYDIAKAIKEEEERRVSL
jgi:hypothetical protein